MQLPNFGAHNKQVYLALIGGAVLLGIYLRRRASNSSNSTDPTVGDTTSGANTPDLSGLENYSPSDGTVTTAGGATGPAGPAGPRGPRGPKGAKGPPRKHHPTHHGSASHKPRQHSPGSKKG